MQHTYFLFKTLDQVQRATPKWVELPGVTLPSKPVSPSKHFPESRFQQNLASRFILLLPQPLDLGSRRQVFGLLVFQRNVYNLISQMIPI